LFQGLILNKAVCSYYVLRGGEHEMAQRPFAGRGTVVKLNTLSDYLSFYTRALGGKFRLSYLDAFAGTGEIPFAEKLPLLAEAMELENVIEGSAWRALKLERPFDQYVFVDARPKNVAALDRLKTEFPALRDRIDIRRADANVAVAEFCRKLGASDRAVIFLDPFGNQVQWTTIEIIAATTGIDLWYLFPAGLGVTRQITTDGRILADAEASLDRMFGNDQWRNVVVERRMREDLFGDAGDRSQKVATADSVTRFMIGQMKGVFRGGVLDRWLPLGKQGRHEFSLLFAWSNPSEKAAALAKRVATDIMRRK
jgi:three-Cys-motif partner protein